MSVTQDTGAGHMGTNSCVIFAILPANNVLFNNANLEKQRKKVHDCKMQLKHLLKGLSRKNKDI
jgi:hypothetical protein